MRGAGRTRINKPIDSGGPRKPVTSVVDLSAHRSDARVPCHVSEPCGLHWSLAIAEWLSAKDEILLGGWEYMS